MAGPKLTVIERFWSYVDRAGPIHSVLGTACWLWTGNPLRSVRYGRFWDGSWYDLAHRYAYRALVGPIPTGLQVLHRCDVKRCVRPDHLFLGTQAENMEDMAAKGRRLVAERHGMAQLSNAQVLDIRARFAAGESQASIARQYGALKQSVWMIVHGKTWRTVGPAVASVHDMPNEIA